MSFMRQPGELSADRIFDPAVAVSHIVPYPYSSNVEQIGGVLVPVLSTMSRMSTDASVALWHARTEAGQDAKIVLVGETCYPDEPDFPNTTDLQAQRARSAGVDDDAIVRLHTTSDGRPLNNTYLQTEGLAEYVNGDIESEGEVEVAGLVVMALGYHLKRVAHTVRAYPELDEVAPRFATVEEVLHKVGDYSYDHFLPVIAGLGKDELKLRFINATFDPRGDRLLNKIMEKKGARAVDVLERKDGSLELVNDMAQDRIERFRATVSDYGQQSAT